MNPLYVFWLLILGDDVCSFKPDYSVRRESKSIFSNKKHIETIMPARYQVGNRNIKHDRTADNFMPKQYFPEVDYPTNIIESSKPYYYRAEENNAIFTHFPNDVRANFESLMQPAFGKVNSKVNSNVVTQYKSQPKILITPKNKAMPATVSNITDISAVVDPPTTFIDDELVELILDDRNVVIEPALQYEKTMDTVTIKKENTSTSEKMMSPESESMESYEYMDDAECSQNCSIENVTTEIIYYDHIEVFDDDFNLTNTSFEVTIPIETEMVFHNDSSLRNSSLLQSGKLIDNTKTVMEPEIIQSEVLPIEQKESYIIKQTPMRLRLESAPNMKKKKFLKKIHKSPMV